MIISTRDQSAFLTTDVGGAMQHLRDIDAYGWKHRSNRQWSNRVKDDSNASWKGGKFEDLFKDENLSPFLQKKMAMESCAKFTDLVVKEGIAKKRKRSFSDGEGEWMYDRRWDAAPFVQAKKQFAQSPIVHLVADFSINCQYGADEIKEYGARIWAMATLLESAGYSVTISVINDAVFENGDWKVALKIKDSHEYVSPQALAKVFTPNFYRRVMFSLMAAAGDSLGTVDVGLGSARSVDITKWAQWDESFATNVVLVKHENIGASEATMLSLLEKANVIG